MIEGSNVVAVGKESDVIEGEIVEDPNLDEYLTPYLLPLVLNEPPRMSATGGGISSVCTTLEQMVADIEELKTDTRHAGHYAFAVAALRAGLGFMFIRQWTGQKSAWTQAINLANTITGDYHTNFPKAIEMIPAFAAHIEATKTPKNPRAGVKSWSPAKTMEQDPETEKETFGITSWPLERRLFANAAMAAGLDLFLTKDFICPSYVETKRLACLVLYGEPVYTGPASATLKESDLFFQAENGLPMFTAHLNASGLPSKFRPANKRDANRPLWQGAIAVKEQLQQIKGDANLALSALTSHLSPDDQLSDEEWERSAKASTETVGELFAASEIQPAVSITELANIEAEKLVGGGASSPRSRRAA